MDTARTEYPAMLDTLDPPRAVALLNDRVKQVAKLNSDIADWLTERRRIEELYVANLRKLAQKQPPDDTSELGVFTTPWQKITGAASALAESHHHLAARIETDIEKPLRSYATSNREMQSMSTMQGNLQFLAKDYESAQKKADKLSAKGGNLESTKVVNASSDFENASSQWTSQAPYVFEALQALDESRCNFLRDALTQFETLEVDRVERDRKTAENTLNSLLNVETSEEIRTFALRNTGSGGPRTSAAARRASRAPASSSLAPIRSNTEERVNQLAPSVSEDKKSRLGGLKRLGTVMSRRRQSTQPPLASTGAGGSITNFSSSLRSNGERPTVQRDLSNASLGSVQPPPGPPPRSRSHGIESITTPSFGASVAPPSETAYEQRGASFINGGPPQLQAPALQEPLNPTFPSTQIPSQSLTRDADGFAVPPPPSDPISRAQLESASFNDTPSPQPKVMLRDAPITEDKEEADSAMANLANKLREQAAPPRRTTTQRGRRDVRNTVFLPSAPAFEESRSEQPAGPSSPTAAQVAPSSPPPSASAFVSSLQAGQSPFSSSITGQSPFSSSITGQSPFSSSVTGLRPSLGDDQASSDTQSIRSSSSALAGGIKHPDLQSPGLGSSVVETVSAWLENGSVTRAVVIGEMALAHNVDPSLSSQATSDTIRLDNFSALEKVAPNPAFITQISGDRPGEYTVDLNAIPRTSVAFKYQVHLDSTLFAAQAPLVLTPTWKVEPTQTSVILAYSPSSGVTAPITLSNVVLAIHIDGKATTCLSKPTGAFSKERSLIYWRMESLSLTPGAAPQKLLARFATVEEAKPGRVEAKWELADSEGAGKIGSGLGISRLESGGSDPFADQEDSSASWKAVPCARKLISGTYIAS